MTIHQVQGLDATPVLERKREAKEQVLPRVWALLGHRAGENTQIRALAEALEWPFELKRVSYRKVGFVPNLLRRATVAGVRRSQVSNLAPPWPDLVISSGLRNEPITRWIKRQSGGRTKVVHLGRTWAPLDRFDLVITTPQYRLPERDNVLQNQMTLHRVTPARLVAEALKWRNRFRHLPKPYVAVLVGGNSGPFTFGVRAARRLARQASEMAGAMGGSVLVTTSARTSPRAADVLQNALEVPAFVFRWMGSGRENPYFAYLALSHSLIVTGDSIAMLSEASATGKPVYIFDLGVGARSMRGSSSADEDAEGNDLQLKPFFYRQMMRFGPRRLSRDITLVHRQLVASGRATWLGEGPSEVDRSVRLENDVDRAVRRVRELMGRLGS